MKSSTKVWIIIAVALILTGSIAFCATMMNINWDFSKLSTSKLITNEYDITEEYKSISVKTDTADVKFMPSADDGTHVTCLEDNKTRHNVFTKDGVLNIELDDKREWYEYIGINFKSPTVIVYLPKAEFERIEVVAATGDILMAELSAEDIKINVSTGDITLKSVRCGSITSNGSTGDTSLLDVVAENTMKLRRSTGDIRFTNCDAEDITLETGTGDITGSLLTKKAFKATSGTGDVSVPDTQGGGSCKATTGTGDIKIKIS